MGEEEKRYDRWAEETSRRAMEPAPNPIVQVLTQMPKVTPEQHFKEGLRITIASFSLEPRDL